MNKRKLNNIDSFILIIPAYNEEEKINRTVETWARIIKKHPGSEMLVIDDGSRDDTGTILKKLQKKYRFLKVIIKKNEGHGKTIHQGYRVAVKTNHNWIFQTDSDGQFNPSDFYKLWIHRSESQLILGNRSNRKDPKYRILISKVIELFILLYFGLKIVDPNIPFRLISKKYLSRVIKDVPQGVFAPNIFLSIIATRDGVVRNSIAVRHYAPSKGHGGAINKFKGLISGFFELLHFRLIIFR